LFDGRHSYFSTLNDLNFETMRIHVISAVFKRNVASYFAGMLGYLFIVVFVVAGAFLAFNAQFFTDNLANLDQLSEQFPLLLLFIVPAITMTAWSDERKLGTDELLFTLPASDFEILLGKYLAVLAVYTIALLFSLTHAMVLAWLGEPDLGLILTTYFGYWIAGAALVAAGMFASALTSSATVAFVLGAVICAFPVFIDQIPGVESIVKEKLNITEPLSVGGHLKGFTSGRMSYAGLFYFIGLGTFFLYLNAVLIARRHWAGGKNAFGMWTQFLLRIGCLGAALVCLTYSLAVAGGHADTTIEKLHTLSSTTQEIIDEIPDEKPVTIQAFVSKDVPPDYTSVKKELIDRLEEFDSRGGKNIEVRVVNVEPFTEQSQQAEALGIEARMIQTETNGRFNVDNIYMGFVLTSGFDTIVVPFIDKGTPIEYELTRSIGTASLEKRRVVGILKTDVNAFGGFTPQFQRAPEWSIVTELKKQYEVKEVSPDSPIEDEMDVLVALMPSSLTQPQMDNLVTYIEAGKPILIFDDPAPVFGSGRTPGISWAPLEAKPSPGGGGMMGMRQPPSEPKADNGLATSLTSALGIGWNVRKSAFDVFNPHPRFSDEQSVPNELIFLDSELCLNGDHLITSGLQEIITYAPGQLTNRDKDNKFEKLILTRADSTGLNDWDDITRPGIFGGRNYVFDAPAELDEDNHIIAARITSKANGKKRNAIFVADVDIVADPMFSIWQTQLYDLKIDNVLFVLNCVDSLAGDERYITLRNSRAKHRKLTRLDHEKKAFEQKLQAAKTEANEKAEKAVDDAQDRLKEVLDGLRKEMESGNVDAGTIQVRVSNAAEAEQRKLTQKEKEIELEKEADIRRVRTETHQEIKKVENRFWRWAVLVPPLPAIILGLIVLLMRLLNERQGIASDRLRD